MISRGRRVCFVATILVLLLASITAHSTENKPFKITVYFIRHAESLWNHATDGFTTVGGSNRKQEEEAPPSSSSPNRSRSPLLKKNMGAAAFGLVRETGAVVGRFAQSVVDTTKGVVTGILDDAALSEKGEEQAKALAAWLQSKCPSSGSPPLTDPNFADACVLNRRSKTVGLFASNLQRTRQTLTLALWNRLSQALIEDRKFFNGSIQAPDYETIYVLKDLQEVSCNIDAQPRSVTRQDLPSEDRCYCKFDIGREQNGLDGGSSGGGGAAEELFNLCNLGQITTESTLQRFNNVIRKLYQYKHEKGMDKVVIVGHSYWLKEFFKLKFHPSADGDGKSDFAKSIQERKISNTGVIKFNLMASSQSGDGAEIEPFSTFQVYSPPLEVSVGAGGQQTAPDEDDGWFE